jgi:hypothetical protein
MPDFKRKKKLRLVTFKNTAVGAMLKKMAADGVESGKMLNG